MKDKKLKSAYELAMERLSRKDPSMAQSELSDEVKARIQAVRQEYDAKIAERSIMLSSKLKTLQASVPPGEAMQRRNDLEAEHERSVAALKAAMEEKIRVIRAEDKKD